MGVLKSGPIRLVAALTALAACTSTEMPAAAQGACPALASSVKASWNDNLIGLASARRSIERANQNLGAFATVVEDVAAARADCTRMLGEKASRGNIWAYECVADSTYLLARHRPDQSSQQRDADYAAAYCAYVSEATLAKGNGQRERERRAASLEGQGRALQGRSELGGADASRYQFDAAAAYNAAANLQPTPQRYLALARAQAASGNARTASASYDKLQGLPSDPVNFPNSLRAAALREQARIQHSDPAAFTVAAVRDVWDRARELDPTAESHFGYARTYFDAGDVVTARTAFNEAANARNDGGGPINYASEAAYYVSVIDARTASSSGQWAQVLASAQRAGPGDLRYRRLACMAYIGRGGEPLTRDDVASPCSGDDTADGQLLRGMYKLRRAQYLPDACKAPRNCSKQEYTALLTGLLNDGLGAFQRGKALAANEAAFNWLEQAAAAAPKARETLEYGEALANKLSRLDGCTGAPPAGAASAMDVFRRLDLMGCAPTSN